MTNTDIQSALNACRLAWEQHPEATYGWNIHHEVQIERLTEPIEKRIQYILNFKPRGELITRFNNMRPVVSKLSDAYINASEAYHKASDADIKARNAYINASKAWYKANGAYRKAGDAYRKASDAYRKAYGAYRKASDVYMQEHLIDVPDTTWNGRSIF